MKEFIDKLIGRLEEELKVTREMQTIQCKGNDGYGTPLQAKLSGEISAFLKVQNIVNQLAEEYKPKTNADKIRSMTDEELAEFLNDFDICPHCEYQDVSCGAIDCKEMFLKWLQSEAE